MKTSEITINGKQYKILLPPVTQCIPLSLRAGVLLGPSLGAIVKDKNKRNLEDFSQVLAMVDPLAVNQIFMDAAFAAKLTCGSETICDQISFDRHFDENRRDVFLVLPWVLWECVKDFFPELGAFTQEIKTTVEKLKAPGLKFQAGGKRTTG